MKVKNEKFENEDVSKVIDDIMRELDSHSMGEVSEDEAKEALASMVYQGSLISNQAILQNKNYMMPEAKQEFAKAPVIGHIWNKLLKIICSKFDENTEREELVKIIIQAIAKLVPFAIIIKPLIKIIIEYILKNGHTIICRNVEVI